MWRCPKCNRPLPDEFTLCVTCLIPPEFIDEPGLGDRPDPGYHVDLPVPSPETRRVLWIEMMVVITIAVLPDLGYSILHLTGLLVPMGFVASGLSLMFRST